ncbi:MAG: DUF493 domain-containing protein [Gammaproteobacteria bacterium]|nr:DUF493 domain-containing protein [Gammaproteobacteria bacterium]
MSTPVDSVVTPQQSDEETLFEFPCQFPIKAMGAKAEGDFEQLITSIIEKHVPNLKSESVKTRESKNGNYAAVTVTITATSKQQLDNIYLELNGQKEVLMTL